MPDIKIVTMYNEEPDRRYRTLVLLQRSDRPKYWRFHCVNCQQPIAELANNDVYAITDFYDPQNTENSTVGMRCSSPMCRRWYYFKLM